MNLAAKFRPRADAAALSRYVQDAWQVESDRVSAGVKDAALRERLTALLETLYPLADMEILQRWQCAAEATEVAVAIYSVGDGESYGRWNERVRVELTRPVLVKSGYGGPASLATPAPWYFEEALGLSDKRRAEMSADEWVKHVEEIKGSVARSVPHDLCAPFDAFALARQQFQREYRQATNWPAEYKAQHGDYPTWAQICDEFPIIGAHIRALGENG